jgi:hypothetical protein
MACPHCGEHLLHKRDGALLCCRCGRVRHDLASVPLLSLLQRHGIVLAMSLLGAPLALGTAAMEGMRSQVAQLPAEQLQLALPEPLQVSQARLAER